jgi:hypothetical protein
METMLKTIERVTILMGAALLPALAQAQTATIHNIEHPTSGLEGLVTVTVEIATSEVACVAYRDGVPVGSGRGITIANIANVLIQITQRSGKLTVSCSKEGVDKFRH